MCMGCARAATGCTGAKRMLLPCVLTRDTLSDPNLVATIFAPVSEYLTARTYPHLICALTILFARV